MDNFFNLVIPGFDAANPGITGLENSAGIAVPRHACQTIELLQRETPMFININVKKLLFYNIV